jgi:hypothetical protein
MYASKAKETCLTLVTDHSLSHSKWIILTEAARGLGTGIETVFPIEITQARVSVLQ